MCSQRHVAFKRTTGAFKPKTADVARAGRDNLHITGSYLGLGCGLGCVQEGVKWRGHRPPTLARSVCSWRSFFRCSLGRVSGAAAAERRSRPVCGRNPHRRA